MTQLAIGYCRVSTQEQANEGISLDAQRARIDAWCVVNGYTLAKMYTDAGISGATMTRRQGLRDALTAATKGTALIVYSISRLSRSTKDMLGIAEQLKTQGADLVSLSERIDTTTAAGKMVFQMLSVLSEFERNQIAERTATALQHKKRIGEVYGPVPFGFDAIEGHLIEARDEARMVHTLVQMRAGGATLRECANHLNRAGIRPKQGGRVWYASSVRAVLQRQDMSLAGSGW